MTASPPGRSRGTGSAWSGAALGCLARPGVRPGGFRKRRRLADRARGPGRGNESPRPKNPPPRREIDRLRNDLGAVGAVARDELGLVRDGDIVIRIDGTPA